MSTKVFLSYSRSNRRIAERLAIDLRRAGIEVWQDVSGIPTETIWETTIRNAVRDCDFFVLLASPEAADPNRFVVRELAEAERLGKQIRRMHVAGDYRQLPDSWNIMQMIDARTGHYWNALRRLLADLGADPALPAPLDHVASARTLLDLAKELDGYQRFTAAGAPFVAVPVLPNGYGMVWLVGPVDATLPVPADWPLPPIGLFLRFSGHGHDDTLQEVMQFLVVHGRPQWLLCVEGPRNELDQFELPMRDDSRHVWRDCVDLCVQAVREWAKGRHRGIDVFMHGPFPIAFAVGAKLREMLPYELFQYGRGKSPPYSGVIQADRVI